MAGAVSLWQNFWQFGADPSKGSTFWERTLKNREFWVSTVVDTAVSVVVGLAAAAAVAGVIAGAIALGFTAAATAPLWAVVGVAAIVGIGIGFGVDALGIPKIAKDCGMGFFTQP